MVGGLAEQLVVVVIEVILVVSVVVVVAVLQMAVSCLNLLESSSSASGSPPSSSSKLEVMPYIGSFLTWVVLQQPIAPHCAGAGAGAGAGQRTAPVRSPLHRSILQSQLTPPFLFCTIDFRPLSVSFFDMC